MITDAQVELLNTEIDNLIVERDRLRAALADIHLRASKMDHGRIIEEIAQEALGK